MKRATYIPVAAVLAAVLALAPLSRAGDPHSMRHEVFALAMGGAYTAGSWRGSSLFYNPAALAEKPFHLNVPIRIEFGGIGGLTQLKDVVDYFQNNETTLKNFNDPAQVTPDQVQELDRQAQNLDGKGGVAKVMPAVRLGWRGWGFQLYSLSLIHI